MRLPGLATELRPLRPAQIIEIVARRYGVPQGWLAAETRQRPVPDARAVAALMLIEHLGYSQNHVAQILRKDHSSIIKALRKVDRALRTQPELEIRLDDIRAEILETQTRCSDPIVREPQRFAMPGGSVL